MKKTLIAAAALTLAAGAAQAQMTIYGLIDLSYGQSIYSDYIGEDPDFHSGGDNGSGEGNSTTRIGLKGSMEVASGIKANFNLETGGIDSDGGVNSGGDFFNRQMWAGLSGGWGEVRLGKQDSVVYQVMNGYDFNGASNGVSSGGYSQAAVWLPGRQSRLLNYISPNMGGFKFQAGFVPKGNEVGAEDTFAGAVTYAAGGLSVSLAGESARTETSDDFFSVAGSYDFKVVKVMAGYADGGQDIGGYSLGIVAPVAGFNIGAMYAENGDSHDMTLTRINDRTGRPFETLARDLVFGEGYAQGIRDGRKLKAVVPGGSSTPVLTTSEIDCAMDFDGVAKAGSMLGSAGTIVMDDSTCMVWMAKNLIYFYKHESCGKCSPCREGTGWMLRLLERIEAGEAQASDLDLLWKVTDSISGKTVCPFGDAAIAPPQSTLAKFRAEFEYHVREKRCWKSVAPTFEEALAKSGVTA